mmetsp:Transcript_119869/g.382655  ORF Transcript_119869/g.382655 Transcript_119869/m.382655 type:complete len:304 (+) Transcript_119869:1363-2274(+)
MLEIQPQVARAAEVVLGGVVEVLLVSLRALLPLPHHQLSTIALHRQVPTLSTPGAPAAKLCDDGRVRGRQASQNAQVHGRPQVIDAGDEGVLVASFEQLVQLAACEQGCEHATVSRGAPLEARVGGPDDGLPRRGIDLWAEPLLKGHVRLPHIVELRVRLEELPGVLLRLDRVQEQQAHRVLLLQLFGLMHDQVEDGLVFLHRQQALGLVEAEVGTNHSVQFQDDGLVQQRRVSLRQRIPIQELIHWPDAALGDEACVTLAEFRVQAKPNVAELRFHALCNHLLLEVFSERHGCHEYQASAKC